MRATNMQEYVHVVLGSCSHVYVVVVLCFAHALGAPSSDETEVQQNPEVMTVTENTSLSTDSSNPAVLVLALTFPLAFVFGLLWCYCMSWCLGLTKSRDDKKQLVSQSQRREPQLSRESSMRSRASTLSSEELEIDNELEDYSA